MPSTPPLGELTPTEFLQTYWQKKPVLIRQAVPGFVSPLSADELAGLACEDGVESRLILEKDGPEPWTVEHGPFAESRFASLPASHWTLLVQDVDKYIPAVYEFLHAFHFIPDWRIDDIMISYAAEQGSVGPHIDQYDVFLLQAAGERRWQISSARSEQDNLIPDISLNILRDFNAEQEWVLQPGDMLYLPPGVAHYGVAQGECMTWSVGFRAPAYSELISSFVDDFLPGLHSSQRYTDRDRQAQDEAYEIDPATLARLRTIIKLGFVADQTLDQWLGCYLTEPKQPDHIIPPDRLLDNRDFKQHATTRPLWRNPWARVAYFKHPDSIALFVAGHYFGLAADLLAFVKWFCDSIELAPRDWASWHDNSAVVELLTNLYNQGSIYFDDE